MQPVGTTPTSTRTTRAVSGSSELAGALLRWRADLLRVADDLGGLELMGAYSDLTDAIDPQVWAISSDGSRLPKYRHRAVGGYGPAEMSPFSDVDVAFLIAVRRCRPRAGRPSVHSAASDGRCSTPRA